MTSRPLAMALAVALCAARGAAAENSDPLEEIIVTARRALTPGLGASALSQADIARQRARTSDTASLLSDIPGVAVYGAGGVSSLPVIRGLADDRLRTQVDGVDVAAACPNHMNPPLSHVDPTIVASIDVYAGVTPVSVGGDSIGGTILVRTADPEFAPDADHLLKGEVGTFYRGDRNGWGGNLAGTFATDTLSLGYTGAYAQADNYMAGDDFKDHTFTGRPGHSLPTDEVGSSAYRSSNQSARVAWRSGEHMLDFTFSYQDIPEEGFPNQRMDMTENTASRFNLAYTGRLGWGTLQARVYYQDTRHEMDFGDDKRFWYGGGPPPAGSAGDPVNGWPCSPISGAVVVGGVMVGCAAGMPMKSDGQTSGLTMAAAIPLAERGTVRVGGEYQAHRLDDWWPPSGGGMWPNEFLNVNDGKRDRYAAYGEWELQRERWSNIVGLRYERVATDAGPVHGYNLDTYPTGGTGGSGNQTRDAALFNSQARDRNDGNLDLSWISRYTASDRQAYEFGLAQKTRSPNLYERYSWSSWQMAAFMNNFVGDGNGYFGDVRLDPEVARTVSVTADWHAADAERWRFVVTPYYTRVDDYVDAVQWNSATNEPRAVPVVDNFTVLRYVNQKAQLYGVDFSATSRLGDSGHLGTIGASLVGSYACGKNADSDDHLYNVMPFHSTLALTQELGHWRNSIEGEFVGAKRNVSEVRNEMQTAGYGLVHLRSRYERELWSVQLGLENLLDRHYDSPLGGAYLGQGSTMMNPLPPNEPRWGTPVPGAGRSVYAGLTVKF